jgi:hypothetical protein
MQGSGHFATPVVGVHAWPDDAKDPQQVVMLSQRFHRLIFQLTFTCAHITLWLDQHRYDSHSDALIISALSTFQHVTGDRKTLLSVQIG